MVTDGHWRNTTTLSHVNNKKPTDDSCRIGTFTGRHTFFTGFSTWNLFVCRNTVTIHRVPHNETFHIGATQQNTHGKGNTFREKHTESFVEKKYFRNEHRFEDSTCFNLFEH